jgi:hypothetical protein
LLSNQWAACRPCQAGGRKLQTETRTPLCFINPVFEHARSCDVSEFFAEAMDLAHLCCQLLIVTPKLGKACRRSHEIRIVV